jgi:hypothetical protein
VARRRRRSPTRKQQEPAGSTSQSSPAQESGPGSPDQIEALHESALSTAIDSDKEVIDIQPPPAQIDLAECRRKAEEARQLWDSQRRRAEEAEQKAKKEQEEYQTLSEGLNEEREALQAEKDRLEEWERQLAENERQLIEKEKELVELEIDLQERERNAEVGFISQKREILAQVDEQAGEFRKKLADLMQQSIAERTKCMSDLKTELDEIRAAEERRLSEQEREQRERLEAKQGAIDEERDKLESEQRELDKQRRQLKRDRERLEVEMQILDEDRQAQEQKIERLAAARVDQLSSQIKALKELLASARAERDRFQSHLVQRQEQDRKFGHRTSEEVLQFLQHLTRERDELRQELAVRPGKAAIERLRELEVERESWEAEQVNLRREAQELKRRLANYQIGAVELETLRDQKAVYEASNQILRKQLEELRGDVERRMGEDSQRPPFPSCLRMDQDAKLQETPETEEVDNLRRFAEELQQRIGYDPQTQQELYYSLADIRSFLAGLATSYLTILQGVSGTGKTSLPLAFARAVGGGLEIVEVQAGWRDRQDLIGHFNSFEGKFHESKFLQALYMAQCPLYRNRIFIVVMDEMNLSYPEQYFADLLSALENPQESKRKIDLMPWSITADNVPSLLVNKGRSLRIPPNVWFIGTANQDETTKDFADKTYDRAHVIELPVERPNFRIDTDLPAPPKISHSSLRRAFGDARQRHSSEASRGYRFLEDKLRQVLGNRFGVGWGNRLQHQLQDYVPVVLAAGGSLGEAVDYVLAMKILRKIRNRYEYRAEDLEYLEDHLLDAWSNLGDSEYSLEGSKSLKIVNTELRRLSLGEQE